MYIPSLTKTSGLLQGESLLDVKPHLDGTVGLPGDRLVHGLVPFSIFMYARLSLFERRRLPAYGPQVI